MGNHSRYICGQHDKVKDKEFALVGNLNGRTSDAMLGKRGGVCAAKARGFETDDGRTFAGAVASFLIFVVVIVFFETAVRHPAVCCSLH
jgi:hypothetical protein